MKKNVHPKYQQVLFVDSSTNHRFICGSALQCEEKEVFEGVEYPTYRLSISSASHPFFTGSRGLVDSEGRIDKFKKRYSAAAQPRVAAATEAKKDKEEPEKKKAAPKEKKAAAPKAKKKETKE